MSKKFILMFYVVFFVINTIIYVINKNLLTINIDILSQYSIIFIIIGNYLLIKYYQNLFSLPILLNFFIILFLYGRVILNLFYDNSVLLEFSLVKFFYLNTETISSVLLSVNSFVSILNIAIIYGYKRGSYGFGLIENPYKVSFLKKIFFMVSVIYLLKNLIEINYVIRHGYLSFYDGGFSNINYYSFIIKYAHVLFLPVFSYLLLFKQSKRDILIICSVFIILAFSNSLKGARGLFILPLLFSLWYYNKFYVKQIKKQSIISFKTITLSIVIIIFSVFLKNARSTYVNIDQNLLIDIPKLILLETGRTLQIIGIFHENLEYIDKATPFILEPIVYPYYYLTNFEVMTGGQTEELVKIRNSFDDQLTYHLSASYYLSGAGLGSSFAGESIQFGYFLGSLISLLIGLLIVYYLNNLDKKIFIYLSPIIIQHTIFLARNNAFPNLITISKHLFMYFLLLVFLSLMFNSVLKRVHA